MKWILVLLKAAIPDENLTQVLLDTDYPCLIVLPAASLCPAGEREPGGAQRSKADFVAHGRRGDA